MPGYSMFIVSKDGSVVFDKYDDVDSDSNQKKIDALKARIIFLDKANEQCGGSR